MPVLIRYDHDIVAQHGRDCFFLQLMPVRPSTRLRYDEDVRRSLLDWSRGWELAVEPCCSIGWLAGDPGRYHVDFSGWDDPLLQLWCEQFESADGKSLHPDQYQMYFYSYEQYPEHLDEGRFVPDENP